MKLKQVEKIDRYPDLRIKYVNKIPGELMGRCLPHEDVIELSLKENKTQKILDKSLFHELVHYFIYRAGYNEILSEANVSEEAIVLLVENSLSHLISFTYKKDVEKPKV